MRHWTPLSLVLTIAMMALACGRGWLSTDAGELRTAAGTLASVAATMLGFLLAVLAILASISGHRLLRAMIASGHYQVLLRRLMITSCAFAVAMIVALLAAVTSASVVQVGTLAIGLTLLACLLLVDIAWRLWLVMTSL